MIITAITPKRKHLSALCLDNGLTELIDSSALSDSGFRVEDDITQPQLEELIAMSAEYRARNKALYLLSHRDHSSRELRDKLKKDCDADAAGQAVDRMRELGLVNDDAYAQKLANELFTRKKYGAKRVEYELISKGIDRETARVICAELETDPQEAIREILERRYKNLSDPKEQKRAAAALQRYGYNYEDIRNAMSELMD